MTEQSSIVTVEDKQETLIGKVCNPWMWRVANGFMALFFAFASYVQVSPPLILSLLCSQHQKR